MRLIDANDVKHAFNFGKICAYCDKEEPLCSYDCKEPDRLTKAMEGLIDSLPTVDAVPVVHAYPIFDYKRIYAKCSNCMQYTIRYFVYNWDNYCSMCGAKMDGDRNAAD